MSDLAGIINLAEPTEALGKLTLHRTLGAVPFGGRYRLIDFTLSNMVNAGIRNVGILIDDKFGPLLDHIKDGRAWDLDRQRDGLFLLQPAQKQGADEIQNLYYNRLYLKKTRQSLILFSGSGVVANIDLKEALNFHREKKADVTVICSGGKLLGSKEDLTLAADRRVLNSQDTQSPAANKSLAMYILSKGLFTEIVASCAKENKQSFLKDGLIPNLKDLKVYGFEHLGYAGLVDSLNTYYRHSLEILSPRIWRELFSKHGQIHTKVKHEAPAKYFKGSQVHNSLVATGCLIYGTVQNSILFRGVTVGPGAVVKDSIVMQKSSLGSNSFLQYAILDKDVSVLENTELVGDLNSPAVIAKREVVRGLG